MKEELEPIDEQREKITPEMLREMYSDLYALPPDEFKRGIIEALRIGVKRGDFINVAERMGRLDSTSLLAPQEHEKREEWLTLAEAAELFGLSNASFANGIQKGDYIITPYTSPSGTVLYLKEDVEEAKARFRSKLMTGKANIRRRPIWERQAVPRPIKPAYEMPDEQYLTSKEAAAALSLSKTSLGEWRKNGFIVLDPVDGMKNNDGASLFRREDVIAVMPATIERLEAGRKYAKAKEVRVRWEQLKGEIGE